MVMVLVFVCYAFIFTMMIPNIIIPMPVYKLIACARFDEIIYPNSNTIATKIKNNPITKLS
jgi:hypothetical protein